MHVYERQQILAWHIILYIVGFTFAINDSIEGSFLILFFDLFHRTYSLYYSLMIDNDRVIQQDVDIFQELFDFEGWLIHTNAYNLFAVVELESVAVLHDMSIIK